MEYVVQGHAMIGVNSYWVYILGSLGSCSSICLNTGLPLKTKLFIVSVCVSIINLSLWKTHLRETALVYDYEKGW